MPTHQPDADAKAADLGVAAWSALLRAHAAIVPVLEREVQAATGLPLSWYDVLLELNAASRRRLRMQQLSDRVVLSRSRVSRIVDDMARAGLVDRTPDPEDGRAALVALTPSGRAQLRAAAPVYLRAIDEHFSRHVHAAELRAVCTGLERAVAHVADERYAGTPVRARD